MSYKCAWWEVTFVAGSAWEEVLNEDNVQLRVFFLTDAATMGEGRTQEGNEEF